MPFQEADIKANSLKIGHHLLSLVCLVVYDNLIADRRILPLRSQQAQLSCET